MVILVVVVVCVVSGGELSVDEQLESRLFAIKFVRLGSSPGLQNHAGMTFIFYFDNKSRKHGSP